MNSVNNSTQGRRVAGLLIVLMVSPTAHTNHDTETTSDPLRIAVATNFVPVLEEIAVEFTASTNVELGLVTGSTGKLYAQIKNGLHVDLFLSADQIRINRLVEAELTIQDTLTTYAHGRLVWWQPGSNQSVDWANKLNIGPDIRVIAHAQPELAPYGKAAVQALSNCFHVDRSRISFVQGENVGQAYAYVATGNADAGLVALSNIKLAALVPRQSYSNVPSTCHKPIKQDAVVLRSSRSVTVARRFIEFLGNNETRRKIAEYGYELP